MTEALNEVEAEASVIFRQRRHALLVLRPLASSQLADPALESDAGCEAGGALGAARLAFGDGALSHDRVFAALLGGGPLSEVAPFVYLIAEGNGLRVIARGPLRVVELPNAPQVGIRPSVINSGDALTWVEAVLPTARGVEVTVHDDRRGLDEVPIQLFFAERDEEISETLAPANEAPETAADPDLDGAVGPGEAVQEGDMLEEQTPSEDRTPSEEQIPSDDSAADASDELPEATIIELPSDDELALEDGQALGDSLESGGDSESDGEPNRGAHTFPVPILDAEAQADLVGEHDGRTILSDEASRIRQEASARRAARQESRNDADSRSEPRELGEHDGFTVVAASLRDLRGGAINQAGLGELGETVLAQALSFETHPEGELRRSQPGWPRPPRLLRRHRRLLRSPPRRAPPRSRSSPINRPHPPRQTSAARTAKPRTSSNSPLAARSSSLARLCSAERPTWDLSRREVSSHATSSCQAPPTSLATTCS